MLTIILISALIIYFLELIFLHLGLKKANRVQITDSYEPTVSVIVAARNEEKSIGECIDSLINLNYPKEKLEIIIINDNSTDKTPEIIDSFVRKYPLIKTITAKPGLGNLQGKANAITQGIEISKGEILIFTDADCRVQPEWIKQTVRYFVDDVGIVGGFTLLDANRIFEGIQTLDWMFLLGIASATTGWEIPLTAIGNNLAVRRIAYEKTGGYRKIPFSVTEDYALVQAIVQRTNFKVRFPINSLALVKSKPCSNIHHLYSQKKRWGIGGLDMVTRGLVIMAIGWIAKFLLMFSFLFAPVEIWLASIFIMGVAETSFIYVPLKHFKNLKMLKYTIPFLLYFFIYVLILPFIVFSSKQVSWKERQLGK
jgi:cellulose synthase/poly-beta-1,6-N-acetylglucosamine synthase-like glycosyltransferase